MFSIGATDVVRLIDKKWRNPHRMTYTTFVRRKLFPVVRPMIGSDCFLALVWGKKDLKCCFSRWSLHLLRCEVLFFVSQSESNKLKETGECMFSTPSAVRAFFPLRTHEVWSHSYCQWSTP